MTPPFIEQKCVSKFESNEDLIDSLLASGHIPGIFGLHNTRVGGIAYIDGAFSNSHPVIDKDTIVVNAMGFPRWFSRNPAHSIDIYPRKPYGFFEMLAVFGVPGMSRCDQISRDGYRDAEAADHIFLSRGWVKRQNKLKNWEHATGGGWSSIKE